MHSSWSTACKPSWSLAPLVFLVSFGVPQSVLGDSTPVPSVLIDGGAVFGQPLSENAPHAAACRASKYYTENQADLVACYGESSKAGWAAVSDAADAYSGVACVETVDPKLAPAKQKLEAAKERLPALERAHSDASIAKEVWLASSRQAPGAEQKLIDATKAERDALEALAAAKAQVAALEVDLARVEKEGTAASLEARNAGLVAFQAAISSAESTTRSEADFEALLEDQARRTVCLRLQTKLNNAYGGDVAQRQKAEAINAAASDHQTDILRKSQGTASATTTTSSLIENPGSPDKAAYSILTALGADSKTTGTQTILNLNLSSLVWRTDAERLRQPVWQRNLFLRGAFPLSTTDKVPQTGAGATSAGSSTEVSRFSLLVGGSLLDESDTRLPSEQDCYKLVTAYVPFPQTHAEASSRSKERKRYYDLCAHIAANKTRLAWRAGMGFYTPNDEAAPKTRPELAVGAIVWGPYSWLYLNFLYQGIVRPDRVDNLGAGFSFAGNVDGTRSGVDATLRVGLEYLFLFNYAHANDSTDWEMRIAPTLRGKLFGNTIGTLAVGPRFLGSKLDSPGLLATLALSYDADVLVDSLLMPPMAKSEPSSNAE